MSRRGSGEGSIYKDGSLWVATVETGRDPMTGKRQRRKVKARTKAEALRRAKVVREQVEAGVTPDGTLTVAKFIDRWLGTVVAARVGAERTVTDYRGALAHVKAALGTIPLIKLTPEHVEDFLKAEAGLSRSYVGRMRMLLADALSHAQHRGLVARNVAALSVMPKCKPKTERQPYTSDQIRALMDATQGERLAALALCGLTLALRPGELTGLLWQDLDLDSAPPTLAITGSMKRGPDGQLIRGPVKRSRAGERTIELPPFVATSLRDHRRRQAEKRLSLGELWTDNGLIFCSQVGTPLDPANLRHTFTRIAKKAGLTGFPYLMRHTVVSLLLDGGATIDEVADLTGDDPVTLYRYYRHRVKPVARVAAVFMPDILAGPDPKALLG
jgi:integrase